MSATFQTLPCVANQFTSPAAEGAAIAMLAVIFFLAFSIFAAAMVLRNRARCAPRPEDELLEQLKADERRQRRERPIKQTNPANNRKTKAEKPHWEREADWWKHQDK